MEFPHLGQHCKEKSCKQLDFLPMKCDACGDVFCKDHFHYENHSCDKMYLKNHQVPLCPLCNEPIPIKRGEQPDLRVGEHIDRDCQSDPAQKKRNAAYSNKCALKGCKTKELIPIICDQCNRNYCLKHRHPTDHKCQPTQNARPASKSSKAAAAAMLRSQQQQQQQQSTKNVSRQRTSNVAAIQGNLSEDEALARALQQSMADTPNARPRAAPSLSLQEEEDRMLAEAIAASQRQANRNKDKCLIS